MQCIQYHLYMIECQCFLIRIYAARCFHMVLHAMLCMIQGKRIIVYLYFKPVSYTHLDVYKRQPLPYAVHRDACE